MLDTGAGAGGGGGSNGGGASSSGGTIWNKGIVVTPWATIVSGVLSKPSQIFQKPIFNNTKTMP